MGLWRNWSDAPDLGSDAENDACEFESHQAYTNTAHPTHFIITVYGVMILEHISMVTRMCTYSKGSNPFRPTNILEV